MIIRHRDTWHPWSRRSRPLNPRPIHRHYDGTHIKRTIRRTWQQWALIKYRQARRAKRRQMRRHRQR